MHCLKRLLQAVLSSGKHRAVVVACACAFAPTISFAQAAIPVRELNEPDAKSTDRFGVILNVRQLAGGKVLVNDGKSRQLVVLDAKLGAGRTLLDSVPSNGRSYGKNASALIPYLGDSTIFVDNNAFALQIITPSGEFGRVMSAPKGSDIFNLSNWQTGIDTQGNLIYRGAARRGPMSNPPAQDPMVARMQAPDSVSIVRASFITRNVDTLAAIKVSTQQRAEARTEGGRTITTLFINPVTSIDEWAVLSDGTLMIVRGHDYHVDVIRPNGEQVVGAKLPFDWKRLTDADKQALIDSARTAQEKADAARAAQGQGSAVEL